MTRVPVMLTIAGSDSSGGAGIQADLKTAMALGVYGASVITALTAQNTRGVTGICPTPVAFIEAQYEAVVTDLDVRAVKIGMLGTAEVVQVVAGLLERWPVAAVVLDPVMVATSGDRLISHDAAAAIREALLPLATVVTPNIAEAQELTGMKIRDQAAMEAAAQMLRTAGAQTALVKGGHLLGTKLSGTRSSGTTSDDVFVGPGVTRWLNAPRIETANDHGTGCTLSSAIAAHLALGAEIAEAVSAAKDFLTRALIFGKDFSYGAGHGPVHHLVDRTRQ